MSAARAKQVPSGKAARTDIASDIDSAQVLDIFMLLVDDLRQRTAIELERKQAGEEMGVLGMSAAVVKGSNVTSSSLTHIVTSGSN